MLRALERRVEVGPPRSSCTRKDPRRRGAMRYMLMICDDESEHRDAAEGRREARHPRGGCGSVP
jgi:hypothetical protein